MVSPSPSSMTAAAIPKSASTGAPRELMSTFDGLMSRCSRPALCTVSSAPAMRTPTSRTSASGSGAFLYRALIVSGQYSIAKYGRPSAEIEAW